MFLKTKNGKVWHVEREGFHRAMVLRYSNCSLRCNICFAQKYAYLNTQKNVVHRSVEQCMRELRQIDLSAVGWIRILGGEPLLDDARAVETTQVISECLEYLHESNNQTIPRIILQTNGIWLAKTDIAQIKRLVKSFANTVARAGTSRVVIEISFKGPNVGDSNLYALSQVSPLTSSVLTDQLDGFMAFTYQLEETAWRRGLNNIAIYPVAGLGPMLTKPCFVPMSSMVSDKDEEYPLFHPATWDHQFSHLVGFFNSMTRKWDNVYGDYLSQHRDRIPMEGMSASKFQFGWISEIEKRPELKHFITLNLKADWQSKALNLFRERYAVLEEFVGQADDRLMQKISDLTAFFYNTSPSSHYPFL